MDRVLGWLKAAYTFISGDPIVLGIVASAFVLAAILHASLPTGARNVVAGLVFLALIMLSLSATLARERNSARRAQGR